MPRKSDTIPINNAGLDRRFAMTAEDKQAAIAMHGEGTSIHAIAKHFGVSRRLIQFVLYPDRYEAAKALRRSRPYYERREHTEAVRTHRRYKAQLYKDGKIGAPQDDEGAPQ